MQASGTLAAAETLIDLEVQVPNHLGFMHSNLSA